MWFGVLYGSISILQTPRHTPHLMQLSWLTSYLPKGSRLHQPRTRPTGHRYLHNGRLITIHNRANATHQIAKPALNVCASFIEVVEYPNRFAATINPSKIYFMYLKYLSPLKYRILFGNGTLFSKSCKSPKGHILPQKNLPNKTLNTTKRITSDTAETFVATTMPPARHSHINDAIFSDAIELFFYLISRFTNKKIVNISEKP